MAVNAGTANCIQKMPCHTMAHPTAPKDQISFCLRPACWYRVRSIRTFPSCCNTCSLESRRFPNVCCITSFLKARFGAYRSSTFGNMVHICPSDGVQAGVDASAGEKYCSTHMTGCFLVIRESGSIVSEGLISIATCWPWLRCPARLGMGKHNWDTSILWSRFIPVGQTESPSSLRDEIPLRNPIMPYNCYACMMSGKGPLGVILGALWTAFGILLVSSSSGCPMILWHRSHRVMLPGTLDILTRTKREIVKINEIQFGCLSAVKLTTG